MVQAHHSEIIASMEERLTAMRLLALELIDCRGAFRRFDVNAMERHTAQQQRLCARVVALNEKLARCRAATRQDDEICNVENGRSEFARDERHSELLLQTRTIAQELQRLNEIHRGFLARSRRTLTALSNLFASYLPVYAMPELAKSVAPARGAGK